MAVVNIALGANIQNTITANAAGTTYQFAAGIYYGQSFLPHTGDVFLGARGGTTILSGACKITSWTGSGSTWKATAGTTDLGGSASFDSMLTSYGTYAAVGTATFSGSVMTVTAVSSGSFSFNGSGGYFLYAAGVPQGTCIGSNGTGTGGTGTYNLLAPGGAAASLGTLGSRTVKITNDAAGATNVTNPIAGYEPDLFVNGTLYTRIAKPGPAGAGTWWWDDTDGSVNVNANLTSSTVELSVNHNLGYDDNTTTGVTYRGIIFEKWATSSSQGVIQGQMANFIGCTFRFNHGGGLVGADGINTGLGTTAYAGYFSRNCKFLNNGQLGASGASTDYTFENCEFANNNYAGYSPGWEAGGFKTTNADGTRIIGCYVHDNKGPGIWFDGDSANCTISRNVVTNNLNYGGGGGAAGIFYEISHGLTKISGNWVQDNDGVGIFVVSSENVAVFDNIVMVRAGNTGSNTGILGLEDGRTQNPGPWHLQHLSVHDNLIIHPSDATQDGIACIVSLSTTDWTWTNNVYLLSDTTGTHWRFDPPDGSQSGVNRTWAQVQAAGYETGANSSVLVGGDPISIQSTMSLIRDGQAAGAITPSVLRQLLQSLYTTVRLQTAPLAG